LIHSLLKIARRTRRERVASLLVEMIGLGLESFVPFPLFVGLSRNQTLLVVPHIVMQSDDSVCALFGIGDLVHQGDLQLQSIPQRAKYLHEILPRFQHSDENIVN
uniref:Carboxylesterase n=1 Tax=Heligmosomoides polygyrus TaxID=6339 RepID=A0A183FZW0_HELPZ